MDKEKEYKEFLYRNMLNPTNPEIEFLEKEIREQEWINRFLKLLSLIGICFIIYLMFLK